VGVSWGWGGEGRGREGMNGTYGEFGVDFGEGVAGYSA
jgi:hypothetical protein